MMLVYLNITIAALLSWTEISILRLKKVMILYAHWITDTKATV